MSNHTDMLRKRRRAFEKITRSWAFPCRVAEGWQARAACLGMGLVERPEVDFHALPANKKAISDAKAVCDRCPVIDECLNYALETNQEYGIWGHKTAKERQLMAAVEK